GAIAADEIFDAALEAVADQITVDRVEHDDGVVFHAQRRCRVDPVAIPAGCAQFRENFGGVVAALAGNDHVELFQLVDVERVLQCRNRFADHGGCSEGWGWATDIGGREKHRLNRIEILLRAHALHQHRANHAAPTDKTYRLHCVHLNHQKSCCSKIGRQCNSSHCFAHQAVATALATASPICEVFTSCVPAV